MVVSSGKSDRTAWMAMGWTYDSEVNWEHPYWKTRIGFTGTREGGKKVFRNSYQVFIPFTP